MWRAELHLYVKPSFVSEGGAAVCHGSRPLFDDHRVRGSGARVFVWETAGVVCTVYICDGGFVEFPWIDLFQNSIYRVIRLDAAMYVYVCVYVYVPSGRADVLLLRMCMRQHYF
jgi:hypothetical protein